MTSPMPVSPVADATFSPEHLRIWKAAQEFEGFLLASLLRSLEESLSLFRVRKRTGEINTSSWARRRWPRLSQPQAALELPT